MFKQNAVKVIVLFFFVLQIHIFKFHLLLTTNTKKSPFSIDFSKVFFCNYSPARNMVYPKQQDRCQQILF